MAGGHDFYEIEEVLQEDKEKATEEPKALVTLDRDGVDWTGHAEDEQENFALMAYSHSGSDTEVTSCSKECEESYAKLKKLYDEQREQLGDASYSKQVKNENAFMMEALMSVFDIHSSDIGRCSWDFMVMDMLNTRNETMIHGRPFLATIHAELDVFNKEISLGIGDASSRVEKTDDLHNENNYCNQEQGRIKDPRERSFDDYKWMFDLKVDQLANKCELGIEKKGHMLDDIWENCKKVQGDNTYWWHDQKSKEEERRELGINIEEINGCLTIRKRERGKILGYDPKGNRQWKEDPQKDVLAIRKWNSRSPRLVFIW
ncbi:hypothetical protein Tco_0658046 [Tanacetum coccineum]